jgi:hypothetical protein
MTISAINPKHQSKVNKVVKALLKYNSANDSRDRIYDLEDSEKAMNKANRICENLFDKYLTLIDELPKRERERIEKSELYL